MNLIKKFIINEPVLFAASILGIISMFFVPPDMEYLGYIDLKTIVCLMCLMISLKGIEEAGLLKSVSAKLTSSIKSLRVLRLLLVFLCFFAAMLMTNDVALLALIPITIAVLSSCGMEKYIITTVVLQTLAANIGSSLIPIGNPQNLFIYINYEIPFPDFVLTTLPFVAFGSLLLLIICLVLRSPALEKSSQDTRQVTDKKLLIVFTLLFILSLVIVFGGGPYILTGIVVVLITFLYNKAVLKKIDYSLLLTFAVIFILVGNIARIDAVNSVISEWTERDTTFTAVISSQLISNVPAAIMLSGFTEKSRELLLGVNIGGLGTLIASMASVISFKIYTRHNKKGTAKYLLVFTVFNIGFLLLILLFRGFI